MNKLDKAFHTIHRADFLPDSEKPNQDIDAPLPIGFGQTNSQPATVRLMLKWLDPQPGNKVLDVGAGSGWTTALLAYLIGSGGRVHAVEIVPELVVFGRQNVQRAGIINATFHQAKEYGWPQAAPYDRILVSAAAAEIPQSLLQQLGIGGILVIPVHHSVWKIVKISRDDYAYTEYAGFHFVPLLG